MRNNRPVNKIFGIGLPKTGTHSLIKALSLLGYKAFHCPVEIRTALWAGEENFDWFNGGDWDAIANVAEIHYPQLDKKYPNSKFILTVRDEKSWIESLEKLYIMKGHVKDRIEQMLCETKMSRVYLFGSAVFVKERALYIYDLHNRLVKDYFKNRPADLLILNITKGEGWKKLCPFLNKDIPDRIFPKEYVSKI